MASRPCMKSVATAVGRQGFTTRLEKRYERRFDAFGDRSGQAVMVSLPQLQEHAGASVSDRKAANNALLCRASCFQGLAI
jgi:hypothetical protein